MFVLVYLSIFMNKSYREYNSIDRDNALLYVGVEIQTSNIPLIHLKYAF